MRRKAGLKANGRLKKGYRFAKGGRIVRCMGSKGNCRSRKRGSRRRRRGGQGLLF